MIYKLNKLPEKTTNNFKVNDIEIELNIPEVNSFCDCKVTNGDLINIDKKITSKKICSRIGLSFDKYFELDIIVPENKHIDKPVILTFDFMDEDHLLDKININYGKDSSCDFIIIYRSNDNSYHFHHLFANVKSNDNSNGSITYINLMNDKSINLFAIENECLANSSIKHNIIDIGGRVKINNIYSNVYDNASNYINNIYLGFSGDVIDMNYYLNNVGISSKNIMRVEGVLDGHARKVFRGTINFLEGCKKSIGDENENCVLLSNECISRSLPQMLCHEEDVVGAHGVSSGKVDEDKLFYIMSRGLDKKSAEKMIVMANLNNIINQIIDEEIRRDIQDIIDGKLS